MTEPLPERYFHSSFLSQGCEEKKIKDLSQCICHKLCSTNIHWTFLKGKGSLWRHVSSIPDPWLVLTFAPCGDTSKISSSAKFYLDGIITHTHGKKKHQHFKDIYMNKIIKCNKLGLSVLTWLKQNKAGCWLRAENLTSHLCKRRSE